MTAPVGAIPEVAGVRHRFVQARGARFHVAEAGPEGGPPVVLLHGWPQHWYEWRRAMPALAGRGLRVIAPDLRGFGWSEITARGYEKDELALDVLAVLDELGVRRFRLAGHDWGGYIGFLLALGHPDRVARLMLVNTAHGFVPRDLRTIRAMLTGFWYWPVIGMPGLGPALVRQGAIVRLLLRWFHAPRAWSARDAEIFRERIDPHVTQQVYGTFAFRELRAVLAGRFAHARLTVPTLQLHGDADRAIRPDVLRGWEDHADDMRLELLPGVGHFSVEEAADAVLPRMAEFLG